MESLEDAKLRTPWTLKHRSRAVTCEDYEQLTLEATGEVARAVCRAEQEGIIKLIVLPRGNEPKLIPAAELCDQVKKYLDQRRLITSKIEVSGPGYNEFSIETEVVLEQEMADRATEIKHQLEEQFKQFFHPLIGGPNKNGWPMGRDVQLSDVAYVIESVTGVDYISRLIFDHTRGKIKIDIDRDSFPFLKEVIVKVSGG